MFRMDSASYVPDGQCLVPPGASGVVTAAQITTALAILGDTTNLQDHAFQGCTGLTIVTLPDGLTIMGDNTFQDCTGLTFFAGALALCWCFA
jgi:hypothetical protein